MADTKYKILTKEEKSKSEVELEIELPIETLTYFRESAIQELGKDIEIDGFRKGKAPENMIVEKVGEMAILEKVTYQAINNLVPIIITDEKLEALTMPGITVTKIAIGSPIVFKMNVTLIPNITLPDYKKIAAGVKQTDAQKIEEKEMDEYIDYIRQQRAQSQAIAKGEKVDPEKMELPELNDDFVKTLGNFKTVDEFKKELEKNMLADKERKANEARRLQIIEKIIEKADISVPDVLVEQEVDQMLARFKHDIEQMKMKPEDYLKQINKTEDDLKKEWRPDAIKRTKMNLLLPKIAAEEKLKADEKEIEKEVAHIREHNKDVDENHARVYVSNVLINEAVFKFLEGQK